MTGPELYPVLPRLSACIVLGQWKELERIRRSAPESVVDRSWREAVLQTHLFAGFPRLVAAFGILESAGGLGTPEESEGSVPCDIEAGRALFEQIYRAHAPRVRATLESYHSEFATWIEEHAYSRVLARDGLSVKARELLSVACLIVLDQPRQLMSHARGALHCGATITDLERVLNDVQDLVADEVSVRARRVFKQL